MRIEGTEKELKKLFKEKKEWNFPSNLKGLGKKIKEKLDRLSVNQRNILFIGIIFLCFGIMFVISLNIYMSNHYITTTECQYQMKGQILNDMNLIWYDRLWIEFIPFIKLVIICICGGWVLHGVGFKIIG